MKNKLFEKLSKEYTDEELAEAFVFPHDLTPEEKKAADEELRKIRFQRLHAATQQQRLMADLVRLRISMEDYVKKGSYDQEHSFGQFFQRYLKIVDRKRRELANDIGVHYTKLSRLLNDKETPGLDILYRLEIHSGKLISALLWWKVVMKKMEHEIRENKEGREIAAEKVTQVAVSA